MITRVSRISQDGIFLTLEKREHFLSFDNFPWFKNASMSAIQNVKLLNQHHLYWSALDIDLALESIEDPEHFPLVARSQL